MLHHVRALILPNCSDHKIEISLSLTFSVNIGKIFFLTNSFHPLIVTGMYTGVLLRLMAVFVLRRPRGVLDLDTYRDRPNETNM